MVLLTVYFVDNSISPVGQWDYIVDILIIVMHMPHVRGTL